MLPSGSPRVGIELSARKRSDRRGAAAQSPEFRLWRTGGRDFAGSMSFFFRLGKPPDARRRATGRN